MATPPRPAFVVGNALASNIYDFIAEYLSSPDRNASFTAASLTSLMGQYMSSTLDIQNICHLWGIIFFMATTYHASSPKHALLVELVLEIRKCSAPPFEGRFAFERQTGSQFWADLPMWDAVWNDYEFDAPLLPRMEDRRSDNVPSENHFLPGPWRNRDGRPMTSMAWSSLNALGARLHAQIVLKNLDLRAMYALLEALEEERPAKTLDNIVPAAAVWILYAGRKMKDSDVNYGSGFDDQTYVKRLPWSRGNLYKGVRGFSDVRWQFWRLRFSALADRSDLKRNTRLYARQAKTEMEKLEPGASLSEPMVIDEKEDTPDSPSKQRTEETASGSKGAPSRRLTVNDLIN